MDPLIWEVDFVVQTNEDWRDIITLYEPWDGMDGSTPPPAEQPKIDLTDAVFSMHLRSEVDATIVALSLTSANGRIGHSGTPNDGKIIWNVDVAVMSTVAPGIYVYDLVMTQDEVDRVIARGAVEVVKGVTR